MDRIQWARNNPVACPLPQLTTMVGRGLLDLEIGCCCNIVRHSKDSWPEFLDRLTANMQTGRPTPACQTCYREDANGNQSERVRAILQLEDDFTDFASRVSLRRHEIHIKLGNTCPLACRSCQASESSTYARITKTLAPHNQVNKILDDPELFLWIQQQLVRVYENYENPIVHLIGGETLVEPGMAILLDWLIERGMAHKFSVNITTSLAVNLTQDLRDRLFKFNIIGLVLSIDSVGDNYHYVRWPVHFAKVEKNLALIESWRSQIHRLSLSLTPTISISNIFYLDQYLDYWIQQSPWLNIRPIHLHHPPQLAVENIAPEYQPKLIDYIDHICEHEFFSTGKADVLLGLLRSMQTAKLADTDRQFCYAMAWMADYDRRTGLTMAKFNSRLWDILSLGHKQIYLEHLEKADPSLNINQSVSNAINFQI